MTNGASRTFDRWPAAGVWLLLASACQRPDELETGAAAGAFSRLGAVVELCRPDGVEEDLLCATVTVPENRDRPDGRTLDVAVVVVPALATRPAAEPWFDFEGGPGDSAISLATEYSSGSLEIYRRERDVVLIDQRGVGRSGSLSCPELDEPADPLMERFDPVAVAACRDRLSAQRDLTRYTTTEAVRDFDAVRAALGYERIHVFGYSYGTLVAQEYAKLFPERVASLVLWGPVTPDFQRPRWFARDAEAALEQLAAACADDPSCAERHPNWLGRWRDLLAGLEENPLEVEWPLADRPDAETGGPAVDGGGNVRATLSRAHLGDALVNLLYDTKAARRIPALVDAAVSGNWTPLLDAISSEGRSIVRGGPEALYLSVSCPEETSLFSLDQRDPLDSGRLLGEQRLLLQKAACEAWPQQPPRAGFYEPLRGDVPTLVFSGSFDPVTPPLWGQKLVATLDRARLLVIEGMGHSVDGMSDPGCPDRIAAAFAAHPDPSEVDTSCIGAMTPPAFELLPP